MAHHPLTVANTLVVMAADSGKALDALQLSMLTYYAHAWHAAYAGAPLCDQPLRAWPHGPAFDAVCERYGAGRRKGPVERLVTATEVGGTAFVSVVPKSDKVAREIIAGVLETHGHLTGVQLCNSTHEPQDPWARARQGASDSDRPAIPFDWLAPAFRAKLASHRDKELAACA